MKVLADSVSGGRPCPGCCVPLSPQRELSSLPLLTRALILPWGLHSHDIISSKSPPKAAPPGAVTLGGRVSAYEFWG